MPDWNRRVAWPGDACVAPARRGRRPRYCDDPPWSLDGRRQTMKKGIVVRAFSGNPDFLGRGGFLSGENDFARCFERARAAGFDGVQLFLEPTGYFSLASSPEVLRGIAGAARDAG